MTEINKNINVNTKMSPIMFIVWLRSFFEISGTKTLTETQIQIIKDNMDLIFDEEILIEDKSKLTVYSERVGYFTPTHDLILKQCTCRTSSTWCPVHPIVNPDTIIC